MMTRDDDDDDDYYCLAVDAVPLAHAHYTTHTHELHRHIDAYVVVAAMNGNRWEKRHCQIYVHNRQIK